MKASLLFFVLHVVGALLWALSMAGGFPLYHSHFLSNRALPALLTACSLAGIATAFRNQPRWNSALLLGLGCCWASAALTTLLLFPQSGVHLAIVGAIGAAILIRSALRTHRPDPKSPTTLAILFPLVLVGMLLPWTQRAAPASTHPLNPELPSFPSSSGLPAPPHWIPLGTHAQFMPETGSLRLVHQGCTLNVDPLLTFHSRSPDRFWTLFAPRDFHGPPPRSLTAWQTLSNRIHTVYTGFGTDRIEATRTTNDTVELTAFTRLADAVHSHLNTFTEVTITGHQRLSLRFSPCPDIPIEVRTMEYPRGLPARLAYLDSQGGFHVVQATSGEKGPFHPLASGRLSRGEPLTLTILDRDQPVASLTLLDWSSQASTEPSPTAGWGLPQNAIEFSLSDPDPASPATLFITLASTSVGRGFDSVGHTPGTYRNRMRIQTGPWRPTNP